MRFVTIELESRLAWRARRSPTSDRWIGECPELNLVIEADSESELRSLIPESIHLLFSDLLADDELDQFLRERGWRAHHMPSPTERDDVRFDVPWELIAESARRDPERRAH
jgi:hypothetical protein